MKLTEIAAFGGLILGVINLFILLYKDFWRKAKLKAELKKNDVLYISEGDYFFQINIILSAKNSDVQLRKIELSNPNNFLGDSWIVSEKGEAGSNQILYYASSMTEESLCLNYTNLETLKERTNSLFSRKFEVQDLLIEKGKQHSLTFAGGLNTFRYSDGYQELFSKDWSIDIYYFNKVLRIPFDFVPVGDTRGKFWN